MKWPSKPQQLEGLADAQGLEILGNLTGASSSWFGRCRGFGYPNLSGITHSSNWLILLGVYHNHTEGCEEPGVSIVDEEGEE